jgi:hypothetical protein
VPRGLHLPWRLIIRRFELSDKTYSKTNFEQVIRGSVRRASGLVLARDSGTIEFDDRIDHNSNFRSRTCGAMSKPLSSCFVLQHLIAPFVYVL